MRDSLCKEIPYDFFHFLGPPHFLFWEPGNGDCNWLAAARRRHGVIWSPPTSADRRGREPYFETTEFNGELVSFSVFVMFSSIQVQFCIGFCINTAFGHCF
jgi:hypothetical protein